MVLERGAALLVPDPWVRAVREEDPRDARCARPVERREPHGALDVCFRCSRGSRDFRDFSTVGEEEPHDACRALGLVFRHVRAHG